MRPDRPPFFFRLAVVAGGASLVLGLFAAISIVVRDAREPSARGPGTYARVRLVGGPPRARLEVEVAWVEGDHEIFAPAVPFPNVERLFLLLPPIPEGRSLRLTVRDVTVEPPRVLLERNVDAEPGREEVLVLPTARAEEEEPKDLPPGEPSR